jgi:hypothetical protein
MIKSEDAETHAIPADKGGLPTARLLALEEARLREAELAKTQEGHMSTIASYFVAKHPSLEDF